MHNALLVPNSLRSVFFADRVGGSSLKLWGSLWAVATAAGWLLPNHYWPWVAFHIDCWIGWLFVLGSAAVMLSSSAPVAWHSSALLVAALLPVPLLQWLGGMLHFQGQVWVTTTYLLGLLMSLVAGAHAERLRPGKIVEFLLGAIAMASVCSVGFQLAQWLDLDIVGLWILSLPPTESRPFANFGQPNQMATFHLWGLLCVAWAAHKGRLRPSIAIAAAAFLLVGVALTQSRTAMVALAVLVAAAFYWRRLWASPRQFLATVTALAFLYAVCLLAISPLSTLLLLDKPYDAVARMGGGDIRWAVYKMFVAAAWEKPWLGYGWVPFAPVQTSVAEFHASLGGVFQHSHNLFLDLVLWLGVPIGICVAAALVLWFGRAFLRVRSAEDAVLFLMLAVVGVHSMLELPLHYAYMLLPAGFLMGVLDARQNKPIVLTAVPRAVLVAGGSTAAVLLGLLTRDYLLIEADFQALRFERAYNLPAKPLPKILLLDQLAEFNRMGRFSPHAGMTDMEIERLRDVADAFPSPANQYIYTATLALNGRGDEAQRRMRKMARMMPRAGYEELGRIWRRQGQVNPALARAAWVEE